MNIDELLTKLEKVRKTPSGWLACCPAHDDKTPSLTVGIAKSGGLLLHCFGGCDIESVVGSVGMTLADLMPEGEGKTTFKRQRLPALDMLRALSFHATLISIAGADIAKGRMLSESDKDMVFESARAIHEAVEMAAA